MSSWNKQELEQMLEDVVNELDLSASAIAEHGPLGTPPAELVRLVLDQKDKTIRMLRAGMVDVSQPEVQAGRANACGCPKCGQIEPVYHCEHCGHVWPPAP